jgi:hypothetical protein
MNTVKAKVIPLRPHMGPTPPGKVPVYKWQIDSSYRPEDKGEAWEIAGYRDA